MFPPRLGTREGLPTGPSRETTRPSWESPCLPLQTLPPPPVNGVAQEPHLPWGPILVLTEVTGDAPETRRVVRRPLTRRTLLVSLVVTRQRVLVHTPHTDTRPGPRGLPRHTIKEVVTSPPTTLVSRRIVTPPLVTPVAVTGRRVRRTDDVTRSLRDGFHEVVPEVTPVSMDAVGSL